MRRVNCRIRHPSRKNCNRSASKCARWRSIKQPLFSGPKCEIRKYNGSRRERKDCRAAIRRREEAHQNAAEHDKKEGRADKDAVGSVNLRATCESPCGRFAGQNPAALPGGLRAKIDTFAGGLRVKICSVRVRCKSARGRFAGQNRVVCWRFAGQNRDNEITPVR